MKVALLERFLSREKTVDKAKLSDEELLKYFADGFEWAFTELTNRYKQQVIDFLYFQVKQNYQDAEDLTQEVFVQLFVKPDNFRVESSFSTYLYSIARHVALNHFRKIKRRMSEQHDEIESEVADEKCLESSLNRNKQERLYLRAFNQLQADEKHLLYLVDRAGFNYSQASEILDIKVGTVRSRLNYVRNKVIEKTRVCAGE